MKTNSWITKQKHCPRRTLTNVQVEQQLVWLLDTFLVSLPGELFKKNHSFHSGLQHQIDVLIFSFEFISVKTFYACNCVVTLLTPSGLWDVKAFYMKQQRGNLCSLQTYGVSLCEGIFSIVSSSVFWTQHIASSSQRMKAFLSTFWMCAVFGKC